MNTLDYKVIVEEIQKPGSPVFFPIIDGHEATVAFKPAGLESSRNREGIVPILNCGCGRIDCGGPYVVVRQEINKIIWEKIYDGDGFDEDDRMHREMKLEFQDGVEIELPLIFDRISYEKMIARLMDEPEFDKYEKTNYFFNLRQFKKGFYVG